MPLPPTASSSFFDIIGTYMPTYPRSLGIMFNSKSKTAFLGFSAQRKCVSPRDYGSHIEDYSVTKSCAEAKNTERGNIAKFEYNFFF